MGAKILRRSSEGGTGSVPLIAAQYSPEYDKESIILRLPLKKIRPPVDDEGICHDEPGE